MSDERKKEETQAMKDLRSRYDMPMVSDNPRYARYPMKMTTEREMQKKMRRDKRA